MKKIVIFSVFCLVLSFIVCFSSVLYIKNNQLKKEDIENTINSVLSNYNTYQNISDEDIDRIAQRVFIKLEDSKLEDEQFNKKVLDLLNEDSSKGINYYYEYVTNNNSYIETIDYINESEDDDEDDDTGVNDDLVVSEDTIYEFGMSININAIEDETYVYSVRMYGEQVILVFEDGLDLNTISVDLYASLNKTGKGIMDIQDNSFISSEAVDGIYYIVITGLPAAQHEIRIGY